MGLKLKKLADQVVAITGASSGIGMTTAEMAAERGACVVPNARNEADLCRVCDGIKARGHASLARPRSRAWCSRMRDARCPMSRWRVSSRRRWQLCGVSLTTAESR